MAAGTHSQGVFSQLIISAAGDTAPHDYSTGNGTRHEYLRFTVKKTGRIIGADHGIRGSRSRQSERARLGAYFVTGYLDMYVSPQDFEVLLKHMIGDNESGGTYSLAANTPYFGMLVDTDHETFEFTDCKVDKWILRSRSVELNERGEPDMLMLRLEIIGTTVAKGTTWPVSPPALGVAAEDAPYVFSDLDAGVTIEGSTRPVENFILMGDNYQYARYVNSLTPHSIIARDRAIMFRAQVPWNSSETDALYGVSLAGSAATIVATNGAFSTTFNIGTLQIPDNSPIIRGKQEISLILDGMCRKVSTTDELAVVNDNTA